MKKKEDKPAKIKIKDAVESPSPKPRLPRKPPTERVFKPDQKSQQWLKYYLSFNNHQSKIRFNQNNQSRTKDKVHSLFWRFVYQVYYFH